MRLYLAVLFCVAAVAQYPYPKEKDALMAIFKTMGGPSWTNHSNWGEDDPCIWFGVGCETNKHIQSLVLKENNLAGSIPSEIADLFVLKFLFLSSNKITGTIPPAIGKLTELEQLGLDDNQLTGIIPPELLTCAILQSFFVFGNQLTGGLENIPTKLMTYLFAQANMFVGTIPATLGDTPLLQQIGLGYNKLTGMVPATLGHKQTFLQGVFLQNLTLTGAIDPALCAVPLCDMSGNTFSCPIPPAVPPQLTCCGVVHCE